MTRTSARKNADKTNDESGSDPVFIRAEIRVIRVPLLGVL
jgi:hypothetical protein